MRRMKDKIEGTITNADNATTATKLSTSAGSATQPVYFKDGKPVSGTYTLGKSVPSDAKFTDTNTWRGIQNNLTSTSTTDSLSAAQGKALKDLVDTKAASGHTHNYAGSASAGGAANSANKLNTNAGSATQPVYFKDGVPAATTYALNKTVPADAKFTDTTYGTFKGATSNAAGGSGLVPAPAAGAQAKYLRADGTWQTPPDTNTTYKNMVAATSSAAGSAGLVPAPAAGAQGQFLRGDGTWQTPANTWRGIQNNLTSDSTTDSLSAAQGKQLKTLVDGKAPISHTHTKSQITDFPTALKNPNSLVIQANGTDVASYDGSTSKSVNITKASIGLENVDNTADADKSVRYATSAGTASKASECTGNSVTATTADKLSRSAGSSTQPVYFYNGVPVACSFSPASLPYNLVYDCYYEGTGSKGSASAPIQIRLHGDYDALVFVQGEKSTYTKKYCEWNMVNFVLATGNKDAVAGFKAITYSYISIYGLPSTFTAAGNLHHKCLIQQSGTWNWDGTSSIYVRYNSRLLELYCTGSNAYYNENNFRYYVFGLTSNNYSMPKPSLSS